MKVVLLAGGYGTRISEESQFKPKPMVELGGMPILWHIMKEYSHYGFNDFIICAGYKQEVIKKWFADYYIYRSDITFDFTKANRMQVHNEHAEPWRVTVVDTGLNTLTGGRIKRIKDFVGNEPFFMTYGDGVSDVNICELLEAHRRFGKLATLTAVKPEGRFGMMDMTGERVDAFREKSQTDLGYINGGYMVLEPGVFDYIDGDFVMFEREPMEALAADGQLMAFKHDGFWQCMDTMRDKECLEKLWASGQAPWKVWNE